MKRTEAKQINQVIREYGIITDNLFEFLDQEIDSILEEELQAEKIRVLYIGIEIGILHLVAFVLDDFHQVHW